MQVENGHGALVQSTQDQSPLAGWEGLFLLVREGLVELQDSRSSDSTGFYLHSNWGDSDLS